jgi:hypothetical protein
MCLHILDIRDLKDMQMYTLNHLYKGSQGNLKKCLLYGHMPVYI